MLIADNYFFGANYRDLDFLNEIGNDYMKELLTPGNRKDCSACCGTEKSFDIIYNDPLSIKCSQCHRPILDQIDIQVIDEWFYNHVSSQVIN
jgi:hypothetical protein